MGLGGRENVTLTLIQQLNVFGFMQRGRENSVFSEYKKKLSISTTGPAQLVKTLSGGNQQKFVIAKWLATNRSFLSWMSRRGGSISALRRKFIA